MTRTIYILNGPNLNLLGEREPSVYGTETLQSIHAQCIERAKPHGLEIEFRQSNFEGDLIESVHEARQKAVGIIINPAGYSFTSIALLDSLKAFDGPKIEVHLSNIHQRESYYHKSLVSYTATAVICGLKGEGYLYAVDAIANRIPRVSSPH